MMAFTEARVLRYMMSFFVSMWVAGITMAPILQRANMMTHHSYRRFRMSITGSFLPMPSDMR